MEHEKMAELLMAVWRGIPNGYKSKYRRNIWQQFEDNVRSAAYTSNLGKFINSLCSKLQAQITSKECAMVETLLNTADDRAALKLLREETTLLVLMVRVANEARQEEWREKQAQRGADEAALDGPLFEREEED